MSNNPLLMPSALPFGLPDFSALRPEHFRPAFESVMERNRAEIAEILDLANPTIENALDRLEAAADRLARIENVFFTLTGSDTNPELQEIDAEMRPKLSRYSDLIYQSPRLFALLSQLLAQLKATMNADAEAMRSIEKHLEECRFAGADLSEQSKNRVTAINERLAAIQPEIDKRLLAEENERSLKVSDVELLAGLSDAEIASCAEAAVEIGFDGYLIKLVNYSGHPYLSKLENADIRAELLNRTLEKNADAAINYTGELIRETLRLRRERAQLFGFKNHAEYVMARETAKQPDRVWRMLREIAPLAVANARTEAKILQQLAQQQGSSAQLRASDWDYWSERERARVLDLDLDELRNYFELERVLQDGVFFAANQLFGLQFTLRTDLHGYHPDVSVYEVSRNSAAVGLFLFDPYSRSSKQSGAWMHNIADQSRLLDQLPIVVNNLNVVKPPAGEPCLLSFDDVKTLFHEFGHALHGLLSQVRYPSLSGANVERDFVEFPSQVNEMWMLWPEVLQNYARHQKTGESLPQEWANRIIAAAAFNQGFETTHYLGAAMLDLALHESEEIANLTLFESDVLTGEGLDFELVPVRYRTHYFAHIFAGGYSAGYYGYIWSEVLDADTVEWFKENGGLSRAAGEKFENWILSRGGSADPIELFKSFRGREASPEYLMRRRGLVAS